jgi:hypothetical protein
MIRGYVACDLLALAACRVVAPHGHLIENGAEWLVRQGCRDSEGAWTWLDSRTGCEASCSNGRLSWSIDGGSCPILSPADDAEQARWQWAYDCGRRKPRASLQIGRRSWVCVDGLPIDQTLDGGCVFPRAGESSAL